MTFDAVPIAIVGCAHIHVPKFVSMLRARDDVRVSLVWDHDASRAARPAAALDAAVAADLESIWADDRIRAVVICAETRLHRELVLAAVVAGKHLFVEKPLAITGSDAWEMAAAIDAADLLFSTGYFLRGRPPHRFLRDEIAAGRFGTITHLSASVAHGGALSGLFDTEWRWMADPQQAGFGALGDMGSHAIDLILWLLGQPNDAIEVAARTGSRNGRSGTIDEFGHAQLAFADGILASISGSWVDLADPVTVRISGTEAHAAVIDGQLWYRRGTERPASLVPSEALPGALAHAFELFLDALVADSDADLVTPSQAARCSAIIEGCYEAARTRSWVTIPAS